MTKIIEEMAHEWASKRTYIITINDTTTTIAKEAFLAGYKAAQEEADSCEHILDMSKMVDVNGWVSVKERMPEKNSEMLLLMCVDGYELGYYERYKGYGWTNVLGTDCLNVTHWMPLPEPPKEEE